MKKMKLKTLSLKKASISNLNGGAQNGPFPIPLSREILDCMQTQNIYECTWVSELGTACFCEPSWDFNCQTSIGIPCEA